MRKTPFEHIQQSLKTKISDKHLQLIPKKWEKIGDILIIKLAQELEKYQDIIGQIYSNELSCKSVLVDTGGIHNDFRTPIVKLIYGTQNTETKHFENGITYFIDPQKIMFSSGNLDERKRMATISNKNEIVVDLFSGIGYFSLPLAVYSKPKKIYSCEINPTSYNYLIKNIQENNVGENIEPLEGDCRNTAPENIANRVIMGYFHKTIDFFPKAIQCLKDQKGIIHYHDTIPEKKIPNDPIEKLTKIAETFNREIKLNHVQKVKSFAPGINHYVFDLKVN